MTITAKEVYIHEEIDYTLKYKGYKRYTITDKNGNFLSEGGCWKFMKPCMERLLSLGYKYAGKYTTRHNYEHWAVRPF